MADQLAGMAASGAMAASMSMADVDLPGEEGENKRSKISKLFDLLTWGLLTATVAFSGIAMLFNPLTVVFVAFGIAIVNSVIAGGQRVKLMQMETLRAVHNQLRDEVNKFMDENDKLQQSNDELELEVSKVEEVEKGLQDIVAAQGQSVETFVEAVKENQRILNEIKKNLTANIVQDLTRLVLAADRDRDMQIDPEEVFQLKFRLSNMEGVELDEDKLEAKLDEEGYNLGAVMNVIKDLMSDDVPDEEKIIQVNVDKMQKKL